MTMFSMGKGKIIIIFALVVFAVFSGCGKAPRAKAIKIDPYYLTGSRENREYFRDLFTLLPKGIIPPRAILRW